MNDHSIQLVKDSFDLVEPIAPQAATSFYRYLFNADPSMQSLFSEDASVRNRQLMQVIELAISALHDPEVLMPMLQKFSQRHLGNDLSAKQYEQITDALLQTLGQSLGVAFTMEVEKAWTEACDLMVNTMKEASHRPSWVSSWATL